MLVFGMIAVGLVVAGCGGSSSSSTSTGASGASGATGASGTPLSKSEFVAKGNAICKQGNQDIDKAGHTLFGSGQKPSQADMQKFATDTLIPSVQSEIDQIKALTPPAGDEDQVNAITAAAQSALNKAKTDPSLLIQQGGSDPFAHANDLANAYGLTECGKGGG
jgi:hypothetical protein